MLELQKYKRLKDLPEEHKYYRVVMSNKAKYIINGEQKQVILNSVKTFIELKAGNVINKSFILEIYLDKELTKQKWRGNGKRKLIKGR